MSKKKPNIVYARRKPASVSSILERTMGSYRLEDKLAEYELFPQWADIAGEKIASVAKPQSISNNSVLTVEVLDAAWVQELAMQKPQLLLKLRNSGFASHIADIRFITGSSKSLEKSRVK